VLDASPDVYGPPDLKVRGMSHFQPGAVTISTGDDWKRRRAFNDDVLAVGERVHPRAAEFLAVVERHVTPLAKTGTMRLRWTDIHGAFRRITAGVVFGLDVDAESVLARLDGLMKNANRLAGQPDTKGLHAFQHEILDRMCDPAAGGLAVAACPYVEPDDPLLVAGQIPHWLFAMKDTLATNCAHALALVAVHGDVQERARAEVASADLSDTASVDGMAFVEGCLRDSQRLWPTTPIIVRRAVQDDEVEGHPVPAGSQVLIHNGFNHRNPDFMADPDAFYPEAWKQGGWDYRFNALSNGPQACAGSGIVHFLGRAVLGRLLQHHRWTLSHPTLDPGQPIPHAFDHQAMLLTGESA